MSLVTGEELAKHLDRISELIRSDEHDSYEGSITYEAADKRDTYEVSGMYRINDYGGQGSVHLFREGEDRT